MDLNPTPLGINVNEQRKSADDILVSSLESQERQVSAPGPVSPTVDLFPRILQSYRRYDFAINCVIMLSMFIAAFLYIHEYRSGAFTGHVRHAHRFSNEAA
jgi:hypothetical protein